MTDICVPQQASRRTTRSLLQYRSRTLLLAVLLLGVCLTWIGAKIHSAEAEERAVEAFRRLGGTSLYNWQLENRAEPPGPIWIEKLLGVNVFATVAKVNLSGKRVTDADLLWLADVPNVVMLRLDDTQVTDFSMERVGDLKQLRVLWLSNTKVSDTGIEKLAGLSNLQELMLTDTKITDAGLKVISEISELEVLSVRGTQVSQDGIDLLQRTLPHCGVIQ